MVSLSHSLASSRLVPITTSAVADFGHCSADPVCHCAGGPAKVRSLSSASNHLLTDQGWWIIGAMFWSDVISLVAWCCLARGIGE
jgi:hypothetical protein